MATASQAYCTVLTRHRKKEVAPQLELMQLGSLVHCSHVSCFVALLANAVLLTM